MRADSTRRGHPYGLVVAGRSDVLQRAPEVPKAVWLTHDVGVQGDAHHQGLFLALRQHLVEVVGDHVGESRSVELAPHDHGDIVEFLRIGNGPQRLP